ncbi:PAC2 family protein [Candidatus Bathyarchaeota archaeon]|nr:PAC2 family protein [Candidatus Bathyarchaeota archaeon]
MNTEIKILKQIEPKDFTLISGLPGVAYIGKLSVDYLMKQLKAELVGEVYSKHFPPYVLIEKDGLVELLKNQLYRSNSKDGRNFLFLTGNAQAFSPEGQYEVANEVLEWASDHGLKRIFSLAGFVTDRPFDKPNVYITTTKSNLLEEMKKLGGIALDQGIISGANGLIMGLAKKMNLEGACLLGETHGYQTATGRYLSDAKAAKAVLNLLASFLDLKLDMDPLEKQAQQTDEVIAKMAEVERRIQEQMKQEAKKPSYVF